MHRVAGIDVLDDGAAGAEQLVIRMGGDDQHLHHAAPKRSRSGRAPRPFAQDVQSLAGWEKALPTVRHPWSTGLPLAQVRDVNLIVPSPACTTTPSASTSATAPGRRFPPRLASTDGGRLLQIDTLRPSSSEKAPG